MALATRCPHCGTVFRVANDQLKLRSGLVRCGACKEIFNGIEQLMPSEAPTVPPVQKDLPVTDASGALLPAAVPSAMPAIGDGNHRPPEKHAEKSEAAADLVGTKKRDPDSPEPHTSGLSVTNAPEAQDTGGDAPRRADQHPDPLQRMTLLDFAHRDAPTGANAEPGLTVDSDADDALLDSAIEELTKKPYRRVRPRRFAFLKKRAGVKDEAQEFDEPEFVRDERRKLHASKTARLAIPIMVGLLAVVLLFQLAYIYRHHLSASMPDAKDALAGVCGWIGCTVQLPADIESVVIDSSELQMAPNSKTLFTLSMTVHNKSDTTQAWPSIELTLNDASEQAMVRRVFHPGEYVASGSQMEQGIPARTAQSFKLNFELLRPRAAGYKVYLFYP